MNEQLIEVRTEIHPGLVEFLDSLIDKEVIMNRSDAVRYAILQLRSIKKEEGKNNRGGVW